MGWASSAKVRLWAAWLVSISRFGTPIRARFSTTRAYLTDGPRQGTVGRDALWPFVFTCSQIDTIDF